MYHDKAVMSSTKCPWLPQANFKLASWNAFYPNIHCVLHLIEGSMFDSHLNSRNWWKYLKQNWDWCFTVFYLFCSSHRHWKKVLRFHHFHCLCEKPSMHYIFQIERWTCFWLKFYCTREYSQNYDRYYQQDSQWSNRGTQRQFSGKYLFGRRFEI